MPYFSKTFRVFLSSTFSDMAAERQALQGRVFPHLRLFCQARGATFQAIDLRWGVSEEAALDQRAMQICLEEVRRCRAVTQRPNFILLLGDRYGSRPVPEAIEAREFEAITAELAGEEGLLREWYRRDDNAVPPSYVLLPRAGQETAEWIEIERRLRELFVRGIARLGWAAEDRRRLRYEASATHLEILEGLLDRDRGDHAFCYLRKIPDLEDHLDHPQAEAFADLENGKLDGEAGERLAALKAAILARVSREQIHEIDVPWNLLLTGDHLDVLCRRVERDLKRTIEEELAGAESLPDPEHEARAHRELGRQRTRVFEGRRDVLEKIKEYVEGPASVPLRIEGAPGSGKTALLARAAEILAGDSSQALVVRFTGATPESSDLEPLLRGLCAEISRLYGEPRPIPEAATALAADFKARLSLAHEGKPLVVLLDGADALEGAGARWLPRQLPPFVKLVLTRGGKGPGPPDPALRIELGPLSSSDGERALEAWLREARRTLQPEQRREVLERFADNPLPLYLKLAFEEARHWPSWSPRAALPSDTPGLVRRMLERLRGPLGHVPALVRSTARLLGAARYGLAEDELLDLLSSDPGVMADVRSSHPRSPSANRLPDAVWARLFMDLEPYLAERRAGSAVLLTWYHRQIGEVAGQDAGGTPQEAHRRLAAYFAGKAGVPQPHELADPTGGAGAPNVRKLFELPWQQVRGRLWNRLEETLGDLDFLAAKCRAGGTYDLLRDYDRAFMENDLPALRPLRKALALALPCLEERPDLALQAVTNRLGWLGELPVPLALRLGAARRELDRRGPWLRARGPLPGPEAGSIPLADDSLVQALSPDARWIAAGGPDSVEIRELGTGEVVDERPLGARSLAGLALASDGALAWIDREGTVRTDVAEAVLKGRSGESLIAWHSGGGLLAVREDDALVAWEPASGRACVVATGLPRPLRTLRVSPRGEVLFVAGEREQAAGIAALKSEGWQVRPLRWHGPPIVDADFEPEGGRTFLACRDRHLRLVDPETGEVAAQIVYEAYPGARLIGAPFHCVAGRGEADRRLFLATRDGNAGVWHWESGRVERLEGYAGISELKSLTLFAALPGGRLLAGTPGEAKILSAPSPSVGNIRVRHEAAVTSCFLTTNSRIVSASRFDRSVRWSDADGLNQRFVFSLPGPTAIAQAGETEDALLGGLDGFVWRQPPGGTVPREEVFMAFAEPVADLVHAGADRVIAASRSGRVLLIDVKADRTEVLRYATGFEEQQKILPAGRHGLFWSLRRDQMEGGIFSVISLFRAPGREEVVFRTAAEVLVDVAVSRDGSALCLVGESVRILLPRNGSWPVVHERPERCLGAAFLGEGGRLAVALEGRPWIEVWEVAEDLPTLAAIDVPHQVSCLAALGQRIAAGLRSGDLLSLFLEGSA